MIDAVTPIDDLVAERHLLHHPFYVAWREGRLTPAALRDYAAQYYLHVRAFPTYLSALHARCDEIATRQALLANLRDEEEGPENHPALWLHFAEAVGCEREAAESTTAWPETVKAVATFRRAVTEGPIAQGLAALYAYESMVPAVAEEKMHGLAEHYGVSGSPATDYFEVHRSLDVEHAAATRALLAESLAKRDDAAAALEGASLALDAVHGLLDGVCRVHGIARAALAARAPVSLPLEEQPEDEEKDERTDDRPSEADPREVLDATVTHCAADEPTEQRARDAEEDGQEAAAALPPRHDELGDHAGDQAQDDPRENSHRALLF